MSHVQTHHEKHSIIPNETAPQSLPVSSANYNPFKPFKDSITGKWRDPVYSLRRQADLVKMARTHNIEGLLPFTTKGTDERIRKRDEQGLRVKGTGVGERVKGKEWERTMKGRLNRRKQAMLQMPKMIQTWKQVLSSHGVTIVKLTPSVAWTRSWMEEIPKIIRFLSHDMPLEALAANLMHKN